MRLLPSASEGKCESEIQGQTQILHLSPYIYLPWMPKVTLRREWYTQAMEQDGLSLQHRDPSDSSVPRYSQRQYKLRGEMISWP